jgi:hypothetical protein
MVSVNRSVEGLEGEIQVLGGNVAQYHFEECCLLGYYAVLLLYEPTFQWNILPPSLW